MAKPTRMERILPGICVWFEPQILWISYGFRFFFLSFQFDKNVFFLRYVVFDAHSLCECKHFTMSCIFEMLHKFVRIHHIQFPHGIVIFTVAAAAATATVVDVHAFNLHVFAYEKCWLPPIQLIFLHFKFSLKKPCTTHITISVSKLYFSSTRRSPQKTHVE